MNSRTLSQKNFEVTRVALILIQSWSGVADLIIFLTIWTCFSFSHNLCRSSYLLCYVMIQVILGVQALTFQVQALMSCALIVYLAHLGSHNFKLLKMFVNENYPNLWIPFHFMPSCSVQMLRLEDVCLSSFILSSKSGEESWRPLNAEPGS